MNKIEISNNIVTGLLEIMKEKFPEARLGEKGRVSISTGFLRSLLGAATREGVTAGALAQLREQKARDEVEVQKVSLSVKRVGSAVVYGKRFLSASGEFLGGLYDGAHVSTAETGYLVTLLSELCLTDAERKLCVDVLAERGEDVSEYTKKWN